MTEMTDHQRAIFKWSRDHTECPRCGAKRGEFCKDWNGKAMPKGHQVRHETARQAAQKS